MRYILAGIAVAFSFFIPGTRKSSIYYFLKADTTKDILKEDLDPSVDPSEDFFIYANGGWIKKNPIPEDQSAWGIGNAVEEELYIRLKTINEQSLHAQTGVAKKVGDFWHSSMDTSLIEKLKLQPIRAEI